MDHSYDSSSKSNARERPIRTYQRSSKLPLPKEIKIEPDIKLEPDVEIVDDYSSIEVPTNNQTESDQISIHHTYPPEMLVINIKDVMTSTHFDSEILSALKPPSISEIVMKSEGLEKEGKVSNTEQVEKLEVSEEPVKPIALPVLPVQLKRPEMSMKTRASEILQLKLECTRASVKSECPEKDVLKPKSPVVTLRNKSPEKDLLKPSSSVMALLKQKSSEKDLYKPKDPEAALQKPKSPETVLVNKKCLLPIPLKAKSLGTAQVKPKMPRRLLPKPDISETILLKLASSQGVQSQLNTVIESPLISNVSEVVQLQTNCTKGLKSNISGAVALKPCISKGEQLKLNSHDIIQTRPEQVGELKLAGVSTMTAKERSTTVENQGWHEQPVSKPTASFAATPLKFYRTETTHPCKTEPERAPLHSSEATLVKLKRKGGTVLVMTEGNKPIGRGLIELAPEHPASDYKTERPDEIVEPQVIKLNLPEYVVDYEPNSKAPALPPVALLPLIPLPLPTITDDEPPLIVDSVKHLQEQLAPLLPRNWSLRVEKDGIFAMLFAPGLTCAVQRAVYASYDGNELRFIVHGIVVPKDHSVYEYRLIKPPLELTVETVRDFVNVVMGAIHSMIQHHVCIGINDEESIRERRNHPGCRLDNNFYGEEGYTKTLRSVRCAYLVWRKNTKRCAECLFFKTLWRNRSKRHSSHSKEDWEVRETKIRRH